MGKGPRTIFIGNNKTLGHLCDFDMEPTLSFSHPPNCAFPQRIIFEGERDLVSGDSLGSVLRNDPLEVLKDHKICQRLN